MARSGDKSPNKVVRGLRKIYHPIGFSKGYNFALWFIFGCGFFGFILARLAYLNFNNTFCAPGDKSPDLHALPGECYYYTGWTKYKVGIILHLAGVLPGGLLASLQFIPVIRHKVTIFHRMNGYVIIALMLIGNAGAIMIARKAFGGTLATQSFVGVLVIMTTIGLGLAFYNIKRLRIDLHRAWMLRTWFYFGTIISVRFIMTIMALIISSSGDYVFIQPCSKLLSMFNDEDTLTALYPTCAAFVDGTNLDAYAVVTCNMSGNVAELASAMNIAFGPACWLAFWIHAIGVELYIQLTPRESERLRKVSYERRLEAGYENPALPDLSKESHTINERPLEQQEASERTK